MIKIQVLFIHDDSYFMILLARKYWGKHGTSTVKRFIMTGKNRNRRTGGFQFVKSNNQKFLLAKPKHRSFGAAALCEMDKPLVPCGNSETCWQPASNLCDSIPYTGQMVQCYVYLFIFIFV